MKRRAIGHERAALEHLQRTEHREREGGREGESVTTAYADSMPLRESGRATASWRGEMSGGSNQREMR
jgi:hypothetical protein